MKQKPRRRPRDYVKPYDVRWMIRRDMPQVLAIEQKSFDIHWTEEDFVNCLRQRNCIGMVAEIELAVVGYMIYQLEKDSLYVLNFAVAPKWRRHRVGESMFATLVKKLSQQRRHTIRLEVRESNIGAQQFYRAMGMRAVKVLREHYIDVGEDAYQFKLTIKPPDEQGELAAIT